MVLGVFVGSISPMIFAGAGPLLSLLIARERLDIVSFGNVLNQAVFIVLGTVALLLSMGFIGLLAASLVAQAAAGASFAVLARRRLQIRLERPVPSRWPPLVRGGAPFLVQQIADTSMRRFDVVFLLFALGELHVGWYSVAFNLPMMILPLAQSLGLALFPSLVRKYASGEGSIRTTLQRAIRFVSLLSLPIAVGGCVLADRIVTVLYTAAFAPAVPALRILIWALPPLFLSEIVSRAAVTLHLEASQARLGIATTILSAVLVVAGVATLGLPGAALAAVITRTFVAGATVRLIGYDLALRGSLGLLARIAAAALFMGVGVAVLLAFPGSLPASPALALASLIGAGFVLYAVAVIVLQAVEISERRLFVEFASEALRRLASRA